MPSTRRPISCYVQNPPNSGVLTPVGVPLGVDTSDAVGFDISANDNRAYAIVTVGGTSGLITINLTTGAAAPVGTMAGGTYRGLTRPVARRADGGAARQRADPLPQRLARHHPRHGDDHRPAARRAAGRHRHAPGRRPALWRRQHQPALPVEPDHRRGHPDRSRLPDAAVRARASAWTSTRWSIASASSATPSRTSASTRTTAPSPASTRRSTRPATVTGAAYTQQRRWRGHDAPLRHRRRDRSVDAPGQSERQRRRADRDRPARRQHLDRRRPSTSRRSTTPPSRP